MMVKNIIANFIGRFWGILSNFLFIPLYINILGFESYSIISFTLVISGLMAVLDAGLTATLSREFARTDNSIEDKNRIFKTLESSYFIIITFSIAIIFAFSGFIANKWLILNNLKPDSVSIFLKIISFDIGFQLLLRFYMGGLLGLEKQVVANLYQVGWGIIRNAIVVLVILILPRLEIFFLWQTISTIVFTLLISLSLKRALTGKYKFDISFNIEWSVFKRIWRFAGGMLLISLVASLNTQLDKLAISKFLPVEDLGYYTLAVSLSMGIIVLVNPISVALLPRFTALYSEGKKVEANDLFYKINLFVAILVFSVMANLTFFSKELIWIWTGKMELAVNAALFVPFIAMSFAMLSMAIIPYNIAIANGYTKLNNILGIISLFITLPGYWIATKRYGSIGAASVFCIVQVTTTLIYLYFINRKFINSKKLSILYFQEMLFPFLVSLILAFGFTFIPEWFENSRILSLLWIGFSTICVFSITTLILIPLNQIKMMVQLRK